MSEVQQLEEPTFLEKPAVKAVIAVTILVATFALIAGGFFFLRDASAPRLLTALVALVIGVGGIWALFFSFNTVAELFGPTVRDKILPYVFVAPAVAALGFYIVWPGINTISLSFMDRFGNEFIGLDNYRFIFTNEAMLVVLRNTFLWVLLAPTFATALGLVIAVIVDRFGPLTEKVLKSFIFLPMAISFVGASVIWRFVYAFQPEGMPQIGVLNAIHTALGNAPVAWLTIRPWNNLLLIFIMIWLQTGFAMVILSAAVKGVPKDLLDAARIDGAGEVRSFFNVTVPYIQGTILTVLTTIVFLVLKIFDVVYVMTSGQFGTNIIALRMYQEAFVQRNFGRGSALAVILFVVVIPLLIRNVRGMRKSGD